MRCIPSPRAATPAATVTRPASGTAHGVSGQSEVAVEAPKPYTACLECHKPLEFEAVHSHPLEPLKHCGSCHHLHGSPVKGLLQAPVKKLCAGCHDS